MQPSRDPNIIFAALRSALAAYSPPLVPSHDTDQRYELWSPRQVVIAGQRRERIYFAAVIIQKGYVGFYFMPVYTQPEMAGLFAPRLLAHLKGKSCFHLRLLDDDLLAAVQAALQAGFDRYRQRAWV